MTGVFFVHKPQQMTSFACCAVCRRLSGEKRVGHAGTLDPMATGVLPVFLGRATRLIPHLPDHTKTYAATLRFGATSDTLDGWGTVTETGAALPTREDVLRALPAFRGEILQVPPMMSACHYNGQRLYDLARAGVEVERTARPITVYTLELTAFDPAAGTASLLCRCSQGTYIRTLCDDLGRALGCGAVMTGLQRVRAAGIDLADCLTPEQLRARAEAGELMQMLHPADALLTAYPAVPVTPAQAVRFSNGGGLFLSRLPLPVTGTARVYAPDGRFLGLGRAEEKELKALVVL